MITSAILSVILIANVTLTAKNVRRRVAVGYLDLSFTLSCWPVKLLSSWLFHWSAWVSKFSCGVTCFSTCFGIPLSVCSSAGFLSWSPSLGWLSGLSNSQLSPLLFSDGSGPFSLKQWHSLFLAGWFFSVAQAAISDGVTTATGPMASASRTAPIGKLLIWPGSSENLALPLVCLLPTVNSLRKWWNQKAKDAAPWSLLLPHTATPKLWWPTFLTTLLCEIIVDRQCKDYDSVG